MDEVVNFTRMEDGTYDEYQLLMRKYEPLVRNLPNEVISSLKMLAGDTMGYKLVVYPDHAVLTRDDAQNPRHKKDYLYRNGNWQDWGSETRASSFDFVTDLGKFDVAFRSRWVGRPGKLIGLRGEGREIKQSILQERWNELDDDSAQVFRRERKDIIGLRKE